MTEVIIYTTAGTVTYVVKNTTTDFERALMAALEKGAATVETIDGSYLLINTMNAVAIEIREYQEENTPPGL